MTTIKKYVHLFLEKFQSDQVPLLAAALAYYFLLSIVPLFLVGFALIPYFPINPDDAIAFINSALPDELAVLLEENIVSLVEVPRGGLLTLGIIGALWSSSAAMNAFIKASNAAYEVEETRNMLLVRLTALGLTLSMIITFIIAIIMPLFGNLILQFLETFIGLTAAMGLFLQVLRWALSITVLTGFLVILYRFAPNKRLPIKHILPGAITASIFWQLISFGFSFYISNFSNYSATYGSLGGIIILLIWFYLTGMIFMSGAIINVLYHAKRSKALEHDLHRTSS
ncbi:MULTISPECIES: YihY/virulence factor BrkB family protein [Clostridia]|uniref:YihY/virulence factor BrkB family protein n=1 Tax=Clostridia TaxID=186801 RepID=UPI000EA124F0|nr:MULTISPECIES: YihY/virulence factor BrkB family protein [Clostridia]NBJ70789.1 YihY/virulence factor BrkB family protein [Roseburia sp. 1XD42-34]RKI75761.1 YihY/virulence factor BrkB family protein [Clostridium sp. 1xD42-85]